MAGIDDSTTMVVVLAGDVEVGRWRVDGPVPADLSVVEAVARLLLAARRIGCSIRLSGPSAELCELLELVGLSEMVGFGPRTSGVEVGGQAERLEQTVVHDGEEAVMPDDPVA